MEDEVLDSKTEFKNKMKELYERLDPDIQNIRELLSEQFDIKRGILDLMGMLDEDIANNDDSEQLMDMRNRSTQFLDLINNKIEFYQNILLEYETLRALRDSRENE